MQTNLPTLGVGLGFRPPFLSELFLNRQRVDFLEITAEHYMDASPEKARELELLAEHFPLIPHGLNLSLGSAEGIDAEHVEKLAKLVRRLDPPWWSEHIAFTKAGGVEIGHLAPLPLTHEAVDVLCRNIDTVRQQIDTPLILENITCPLRLPGDEMSEAEFLSELLERSDCGLLLDVTNLYTNARNHGENLVAALERLPWERVVQLHFVGGVEEDGVWIDSHSQPTPPEVWELMETVAARAPVKGIILERDENFPPFAELCGELERARAIGRQHRRWD
jgi:uncharacterized protein